MTVYSLPASLVPVRQRWQEERQDIEFRSVFGSQILQPAPPVWATELEFNDRAEWLAGDIKALWMQLAGGNQLEAYDMARPAPLGTMRGTLTLAADVAQGATSMQLVRASNNLLANSDWAGATSGAPGGAPTGWTVGFGTGTQTTLAASIYGADSQAVKFDADAAERVFFNQVLNITAGVQYVLSAFLEAVTGSIGDMFLVTAGTGTVSGHTFVTNPNTTGRKSITFTAASSGTVSARVGIGTTTTIGSTASMTVSRPKLEVGATPTDYGNGLTLLAGDLLGIGSGSKQQVVMVTEDATSTGQGSITVNFEHPLRNAFSAGQAVTWDKPKALFRLRQNRPGWDYERSRAKGLKLDLVESVYA